MAQDVVAWGIDFGAAWSRFAREWLVRHMPALMQVYVEQNFHTGMRPGLRLVNGRIVGRGRNRTSKLYVNTGPPCTLVCTVCARGRFACTWVSVRVRHTCSICTPPRGWNLRYASASVLGACDRCSDTR
ncbi:MAG: hypothetical protein KatS3mg038_2796 [Candidatus Kapaibacterium sp.]|nr:MAG: hypothetical protein KatS3mg038_2796 [Candidatus Kapabacteria bacterium]